MAKPTWSLCLLIGTASVIANAQLLPSMRPELDPEEWWGPEETQYSVNTTIRPFKIEFTSEMIHDLKYRLTHHRSNTPPFRGVGFEYGFNQKAIQPWVDHWTKHYDFKKREKFLNQFPQYKTNIQGLDVHFIWVKPQTKVPEGVTVIPLLIMHGWPGSVREFYEALPSLTTLAKGNDFIIEAILSSLPGFGYSEGADRSGLGPAQIGVMFKNLMNRLGHDKFYIQGGDAGANIANAMATLFPDEILGLHSNMLVILNSCMEMEYIVAGMIAAKQPPGSPDPHKSAVVEESGYLHLLATKPDTVCHALADSPVGLLAFILEKFSTGARAEYRALEDGGLNNHFTKDQLLDNLMMYWVPNSICTADRLYANHFASAYRALGIDNYPTTTPVWKAQTPYEKILFQPVNLMKYPNLLAVSQVADGSHFFAFEVPELFVQDIFKAIKAFRKFHAAKKLCSDSN